MFLSRGVGRELDRTPISCLFLDDDNGVELHTYVVGHRKTGYWVEKMKVTESAVVSRGREPCKVNEINLVRRDKSVRRSTQQV